MAWVFSHFALAKRRFVAKRLVACTRAGTVHPMQISHAIAIHLTTALGALLVGPVALWARNGGTQRPIVHRAFGYAWVTLMVTAAVSALFIRGSSFPHLAGFSPIHLLVPYTLARLAQAFWHLAKEDIAAHRKTMQSLYFGACVGAGVFTLLPSRYLGNLVWGQWLGLI